MNNLTQDERRALAFIAALLFLAAAVRLAGAREPVPAPAAAGFDLESHIAATERAVAEAERLARPLAKGERIDINRADAGELQRLPGVGPSLAERLVEARERGGGFRDAADLRRVPGVGARTAARMAEHLEFGGRPGGAPPRARGQPRAPGAVDVNRADAAALTALPGIGPVLAERIVAYRDSAGPFRRPEDLLGVRGIGPATLARLRDRLRVGRPRRGAGATGGSGGAGERGSGNASFGGAGD